MAVRAKSTDPKLDSESAEFYSSVFAQDKRYQKEYQEQILGYTGGRVVEHYLDKAEKYADDLPYKRTSFASLLLRALFFGTLGCYVCMRMIDRLFSKEKDEPRKGPLASIMPTSTVYKLIPPPGTKFEDVRGIDEATAELKTIVQFLQHPEKFEDMGATIPRGLFTLRNNTLDSPV